MDKVESAFWTSRALIVVYRSVREGLGSDGHVSRRDPIVVPLLAHLGLNSTCTEVQVRGSGLFNRARPLQVDWSAKPYTAQRRCKSSNDRVYMPDLSYQ